MQTEVLQFEILKVVEFNPRLLTKLIKSRTFDREIKIKFAEQKKSNF